MLNAMLVKHDISALGDLVASGGVCSVTGITIYCVRIGRPNLAANFRLSYPYHV